MAQVSIGEIQLLIGENASVEREGVRDPLNTGSSLYEGDSILTGNDSHLHIKFNDGAVAAIRPNSKVEIDCYQTDPARPMCMKLNLLQGTLRKVSGSTSQAHKDKFRLNTPVAAIGVRGTDFITQLSPAGETLVRVVEGAIVASPFVEGCSASGLGICDTSLSALLTANDPFMLTIRAGEMPQIQEIDPKLVHASTPQKLAKSENQKETNQVTVQPSEKNEVPEEVTSQTLTEAPQSSQHNFSELLSVLKDNPNLVEKYLKIADLSAQYPEQTEQPTPIQPQPDIPNTDLSLALVFGTWSNASPGIAMSYAEASEGREVTVGNKSYAIWRQQGIYQPPVGKIDYNLSQSSAFIQRESEFTSAQVENASLSIDFDQSKLDTRLTVVPDNGTQNFNFSAKQGISRSDGIFSIHSEDGRIAAGAISNDGNQVGYMIQQPVDQNGQLQVQTLWQAR